MEPAPGSRASGGFDEDTDQPAHPCRARPGHGSCPWRQAGAREKLQKDGIAFTPEAFLQKVAEGDASHAALFVEAGIDPAVKDRSNRTALWIAAEQKQLGVLKALLAAGVAPDAQNAPLLEYGKSIVFAAVDTGDTELVRALAEAGADVKTA